MNPCAVRAFTVGDHLVRFIPIVFACPPKCRQRRQKPVGRLPSRETTLEVRWGHCRLFGRAKHRVEGDLDNAYYWYRQARRPPATGKLATEWATIAATLLASKRV